MPSRSSTVTRFSEDFRKLEPVPEVPALTILCHPDIRRVGERAPLPSLLSGGPAELSRHEPRFGAPGAGTLRGLDVSYISRKPLHLRAEGPRTGRPGSSGTEHGPDAEARLAYVLERQGSKTPARVEGRTLDEGRRITGAELRRGVVLELGGRVVLLWHFCPPFHDDAPRFGLVGDSVALQRLRREIVLAAGTMTGTPGSSPAPLLLRGASGTGKELVARAVHRAGERREGPWVAVNMAAIPPSLAASELFGSSKGAFTGADRRRGGYFLAADGGTLFLDEIGDTPAEIQPLLLRALENGEIQPVGGAESRRVDVRVIAATDADLEARVADGRFREPLLHRLAGFELRLPSLAERRDDIGRLLVHFLERELGGPRALRKAADPDTERPWPPAPLVARMAAYPWPGNVRQLANVARRLAIARHAGQETALESLVDSLLADGSAAGRSGSATQATADVPRGEPARSDPSPRDPPSAAPPTGRLASPTGRWRPVYRKAADVKDDELVDALRATGFELTPAARALGVSRSVLYRLIEQCPRVRKAGDLERGEIEQALDRHSELAEAARFLEVSLQGLRLRMKSLGLR